MEPLPALTLTVLSSRQSQLVYQVRLKKDLRAKE